MYRHRASRFRLLHPGLKGPTRWQRLQQRSGLILLTLAGLVTAGPWRSTTTNGLSSTVPAAWSKSGFLSTP